MKLKLIILFIVIEGIFALPVDDSGDQTWLEKKKPTFSFTKCSIGEYTCKKIGNSIWEPLTCVKLESICDKNADCPLAEDENEVRCKDEKFLESLKEAISRSTNNDFDGTGFMLSIDNLIVTDNSKLKMFNQESDNTNKIN